MARANERIAMHPSILLDQGKTLDLKGSTRIASTRDVGDARGRHVRMANGYAQMTLPLEHLARPGALAAVCGPKQQLQDFACVVSCALRCTQADVAGSGRLLGAPHPETKSGRSPQQLRATWRPQVLMRQPDRSTQRKRRWR